MLITFLNTRDQIQNLSRWFKAGPRPSFGLPYVKER